MSDDFLILQTLYQDSIKSAEVLWVELQAEQAKNARIWKSIQQLKSYIKKDESAVKIRLRSKIKSIRDDLAYISRKAEKNIDISEDLQYVLKKASTFS